MLLDEEIDPLTGLPIQQSSPESPLGQPESLMGPPAPAPMDPKVKDYVMRKFNLGQYTDENRQKLVDDMGKTDAGDVIGSAFAGLGASMAGRDPGQALSRIAEANKSKRTARLDAFDKGKQSMVDAYRLDKEATKDYEDADKLARESSLDSQETVLARQLASKMAPQFDFSKMTARQINEKIPSLQKIYDIEQKKLDRQDARDAKKQERLDKGSEGQKAVDKDFAKDYNEWTSTGRASLLKNLEALKEAQAALTKDSSLSGGLTGAFPDRMTADRVLKQRQKVGSAIQGALKATLGSAFTDKEGERTLKNAYNEAASPATNIESLNAEIKRLEAAGRANEEKARHFEKNGTLRGYEGASSTSQAPPGFVRMKSPNGSVRDVPESKVKDYEAKGATRV